MQAKSHVFKGLKTIEEGLMPIAQKRRFDALKASGRLLDAYSIVEEYRISTANF